MAGEKLDRVEITEKGSTGDRSWAAYTADGGIGSGKTTRRFRRVEGLLTLRGHLDEKTTGGEGAEVPLVTFPSARTYRADDPAASTALSALLGQPLQLRPQSTVAHHDESPLHLVTTAST